MASLRLLPWSGFSTNLSLEKLKGQSKKHSFQNHYRKFAVPESRNLAIKNEKTTSFTYRSVGDVPLYELPGASFDQYMEDKGRVIGAVFPEDTKIQKINEEDWRIKMAPIQASFLKLQPVIHIRVNCRSNGEDYPTEIPHYITKLLEVHITRWELEGLHRDYMPPYLSLNARGLLYSDREKACSRLMNQIHINLRIALPPLLSWIPQSTLQSLLELVIGKILDDINRGFKVRLLADYSSFKRNKSKKLI